MISNQKKSWYLWYLTDQYTVVARSRTCIPHCPPDWMTTPTRTISREPGRPRTFVLGVRVLDAANITYFASVHAVCTSHVPSTKHKLRSLPESEALPSVVFFAECLLSGTRQRRLCRVPHSVKLGSRQRGSLPSAGHSAQDDTRQRIVCRVSNTRQRGLSAKGRQRPSQR